MNKALFARGRLKKGERNKTEARYEQLLETRKRAGEIIGYWFEGVTFRLADNTRYTPDFIRRRVKPRHSWRGYKRELRSNSVLPN